MLEELVTEINKKHQIPYEYVRESKGDCYFLEIAPEFRIELRPLEPVGLFFRCNLLLLLDPDRDTLFKNLLEANYLYQNTMGYVLGIDPNERYITLSGYFYTEFNQNLFWETLEQFCNALDYLRHYFEKKS